MISMPFDSNAYNLMKAVMAGDMAAIDAALLKSPNLDWQASDGMTSLHIAAKSDRPDIIEKLAKLGANIRLLDHSQRTPLGLAGELGNIKAGAALLAAGANPQDDAAENAMHLATENKHPDFVKMMIAAKFDVNFLPTASPAPLMLAAANNDVPMMEMLLDAGAEINLRDIRNSTALHRTAWKENTAAATFLMARGADETLTDIHGFTAAMTADENGLPAVKDVIAQGVADRQLRAARAEQERIEKIAEAKRQRTEMLARFEKGIGTDIAVPQRARFVKNPKIN